MTKLEAMELLKKAENGEELTDSERSRLTEAIKILANAMGL